MLFQAVGTDVQQRCLVLAVFPVAYAQEMTAVHRFHYGSEPFLSGRDRLDGDSATETFPAQGQKVIDGEGVDEPRRVPRLVKDILSPAYEVAVGCPVAFDVNAEHFGYGLTVIAEGAAVVWHAPPVLPASADLGQSQSGVAGIHKLVHKPEIFVQQFLYHPN